MTAWEDAHQPGSFHNTLLFVRNYFHKQWLDAGHADQVAADQWEKLEKTADCLANLSTLYKVPVVERLGDGRVVVDNPPGNTVHIPLLQYPITEAEVTALCASIRDEQLIADDFSVKVWYFWEQVKPDMQAHEQAYQERVQNDARGDKGR